MLDVDDELLGTRRQERVEVLNFVLDESFESLISMSVFKFFECNLLFQVALLTLVECLDESVVNCEESLGVELIDLALS